jgi:predicted outer membrane repeat protein
MTAASLFTVVLVLLGAVPGETTGWGTGEVHFKAYVNTKEHQEIYPVGAGQYTVQVTIEEVVDDPATVLDNVTSVDICYDRKMGLVSGNIVEVTGTYYNGACPLPYCGRVKASSVDKLSELEVLPPGEEVPPEIDPPRAATGSAETTETTVTMQAVITDDGGESCRARFVYQTEDGPSWHTEWIGGLVRLSTVTQKVAALVPGTRYFFYVEAENSAGSTTGRQGVFTTLEEKVPPIAHPAVWIIAPDQKDTASIAMTADIERDLSGPQEYYFDFVASPTGGAGGTDSIWQFSPIYLDVGLNPNHQYGYRVKARDGHGNETAYSSAEYAYTDIETPAGVAFGEITISSIQAKSSSALSGLNRDQSGLKLENVTTGDVSAWQQDNAFWTSGTLLPNTQYTFRAQARNGDGDLTPFSSEGRVYTLAVVPTAPVCSDATVSQIFVQWGANGNPDGTLYWCQNTTKGTNSAWMTGAQWLDTGLSPNVQYSYRVKARNGDAVETAFSATVRSYSAVETPTGVVFGPVTPTSIQVRSQNTPSGLDQGQSGLWIENVTTGQTSLWRRDNGFWTSDGLLPNHRYGFRVLARNGDGVQTAATETVSVYTQANVPARVAFAGVAATTIQVQWGTNGNPPGTLYLCENATAGTNSGWTTVTTWSSTGLMPNTSYAYHVKARNADGVETAWVDLGIQSTEYRSLTLSSTPGGKVSSPTQSVVRCAPGAVVNLVAVPLAGYHFLRWTGSAVDATRVANPRAAQTTVLVDAQYTLVANFIRTQIYVDKRAIGTKDGSSWTNAYTSLQDALDAAQVGNEIRVAQGTYKPDVGKSVLLGDRTATFELKSGVALNGGYAGLGQPDPNTRDITTYETILSGDLKSDDTAVSKSYDLYGETQRTDNSLHVVTALDVDSKTLLEGVTITAGNGIDGAGVCLIRSHPVVSQCLLRANRAGQLSGDGSEGWGQGAGVSCYLSEPVFRSCVFLTNWAGGQGGGVYSVESSPTLTDCVFQDNEAGEQGGALYAQDGNQVCVDCTFHANWAWDGGAIYSDEGAEARVTNCRFLGNAGHGSGGAVFAAGLGLEITNSLFSGNLAFVDGGAAVLARGPGVWTNCTFNRNLAQGNRGGQALAVRGTTAVLTNCILWDHLDNTREQITLTGTSANPAGVIVSYCDILAGADGIIRKGTAAVTWGAGNLSADPRFQNPEGPDHVVGTLDDDLHLKSGSPCIDAGDDVAVPADSDDLNSNGNRLERIPFDLDGRPRFADDPATANTGTADAPLYPWIVDLGAYEFGKP